MNLDALLDEEPLEKLVYAYIEMEYKEGGRV